MMSDSTEGFDFKITNGGNTSVEEAEHDVDPWRLGVDRAEWVGREVDKVVEETTGGRHLDAFGRGVIVTNPINRLGNKGIKSLVIRHEFVCLSFTRFDSRVDDRLRVHHGTCLEGGDRRGKLRDGEGFAGQKGLTEDMFRDRKERTGVWWGKEGTIERERRGARVRKGGGRTGTRGITRRGHAVDHRSWEGRRG